MRIKELREEIERVDEELLRLLRRRARIAAELGELNRGTGAPSVPVRARGNEMLSVARPTVTGSSALLEELCDLV